jgi:hypothetical protein
MGELSRPRPACPGRRGIAVRFAQKGPSSITGFDEKKRMTDTATLTRNCLLVFP